MRGNVVKEVHPRQAPAIGICVLKSPKSVASGKLIAGNSVKEVQFCQAARRSVALGKLIAKNAVKEVQFCQAQIKVVPSVKLIVGNVVKEVQFLHAP